MEFLADFLPIIIYILLIILLVVGIYLLVRAIRIAAKIENILDNVESKVNSLNELFRIIDMTTNKISIIGEKITSGLISLVQKLFHKRKEEETDYE